MPDISDSKTINRRIRNEQWTGAKFRRTLPTDLSLRPFARVSTFVLNLAPTVDEKKSQKNFEGYSSVFYGNYMLPIAVFLSVSL